MLLRTKSGKARTGERAEKAAAAGDQVVVPVVKPRRKRGRPKKVLVHADTPPIAQLPAPFAQSAPVDSSAVTLQPAPAVAILPASAIVAQPVPTVSTQPAPAVITQPAPALLFMPWPPAPTPMPPPPPPPPAAPLSDDEVETFNLDMTMNTTINSLHNMSIALDDIEKELGFQEGMYIKTPMYTFTNTRI